MLYCRLLYMIWPDLKYETVVLIWLSCLKLHPLQLISSGTTYLPLLDFIFMAVGELDYITTTKCMVYLFYQIPPHIVIECASKISSYSGVNLNRQDKYTHIDILYVCTCVI